MNLDDVKLTLENDSDFYRDYLACKEGLKYRTLKDHTARLFGTYPSNGMCLVLRTYFNDRYLDQGVELNSIEKMEVENYRKQQSEPWYCKSAGAWIPTTEQLQKQFDSQQETTMSTTTATTFFQAKQFINGVDIATMSDEQIYAAISAKEAEIKRLDAIENKPKSLQKKIEQAKADIKSLVDFLDAKDAA